jgi:Pyridoxamine 5'-phosphate oxidase
MVTNTHPAAELDTRFSSPDAVAVPWSAARETLEQAQIYWLTTVRPDGRPHVAPLIAIWLDDTLHFATGPAEQKVKNLAQNSHCAITTGCNSLSEGLDVVVEGDAVPVKGESTLRRLVDLYKSKYDWDYMVRDGTFYVVRFSRSPDNVRIAEQGQETLVYAIAATKVLAFGRGDTFSQTRWQW